MLSMGNIVNKLLKVDFHIHSHASHYKDGSVVSSGTIDNIHTLLNELKDKKVDMFSITDHDCFDENLYNELKKHEGVEFEKIFPGVEFSVWMENEAKQIHVIAIFDDSKDENIDKIKAQIGYDKNNPPKYDYIDKRCFKESTFRNLLYTIGVNAILIVHQKGSALDEAKPSKTDLKSLGKEKMNELINTEYFDAMEYKNPGRTIFQKLFVKSINPKTYDLVKFITGSDCHQWEHYPMHDIEMNDSNMQYSFLKCLPSFRGLVMCFTDYSRIGLNEQLFQNVTNSIESIRIINHDVEEDIKLSKGINVIIGDNSAGKSALLHKLTNYIKLDGTNGLIKELKEKYESFFNINNIDIVSKINPDICDFSVQGGIRYKFEQGNFFEEFSVDKYPDNTDSEPYKNYIFNLLEPFYSSIKAKHDYDNIVANLTDIIISEKPNKTSICKVTPCPANALVKTKNLNDIISHLSSIIILYDKLISKINDQSKTNVLITQKKYIVDLKAEYEKTKKHETFLENALTALNLGISNYLSEFGRLMDTAESQYNDYLTSTESLSSNIVSAIVKKKEIVEFDFASVKPMPIAYNEKAYGDVKFCSRFKKSIDVIDSDYIKALINSVVCDDKKDIDLFSLSEEEFNSAIKYVSEEKGKSGLELLKTKIENQIDEDFSPKKMIIKNGDDCTNEYSAGFNASLYFELIGNDIYRKQILIVDQPEDDISQVNIATETIPDFKKLSGRRQVIIVTHNPQFVVNLDADNVIYLSKNNNGIEIKNGALEYRDDSFDVLSLVENSLDGGEESIKKRWRRYEKNN